MQLTDTIVLMEIKSGNRKAYDSFYKEHRPRLYATVFFLCNDDYLADDIVQEAFLRLWENREKLAEGQPMKQYVNAIAKNLFLDYCRKNKLVDTYKNSLTERSSNDLNERVSYNELQALVRTAIAKFSPEKQEMYIGSRFNGKTYAEIAKHQNTTPKAVERHIAKISTFIKKYLNKHYLRIILFSLLANMP